MKHNAITVKRTEDREVDFQKFLDLAMKLNCRVTDLAWYAMKVVLANPPAETPEGASTYRKPGYWLLTARNDANEVKSVHIAEVNRKDDIAQGGIEFFRFKSGDETSRQRAFKRAKDRAYQLATVANLSAENIQVHPPADLSNQPQASPA